MASEKYMPLEYSKGKL